MIRRMAVDPVASPSDYIRSHIRTVPDWPAPGVMFRDITPLLSQPRVFRVLIDQFVHRYFAVRPDVIAAPKIRWVPPHVLPIALARGWATTAAEVAA